jgi:hypothetical protein
MLGSSGKKVRGKIRIGQDEDRRDVFGLAFFQKKLAYNQCQRDQHLKNEYPRERNKQ